MMNIRKLQNKLSNYYYKENNLFIKYSLGNIKTKKYLRRILELNKTVYKFLNSKEILALFNTGNEGFDNRKKELLDRYIRYKRVESNPEIVIKRNEIFKKIKNTLYTLDGETISESKLREKINKKDEKQEKYNKVWEKLKENQRLVIKLIKDRNKCAKKEGFKNYYNLYLYRQGLENFKKCDVQNFKRKIFYKVNERNKIKKNYIKSKEYIENKLEKDNAKEKLFKLLEKVNVKINKKKIIEIDHGENPSFSWNFCLPKNIPNDVVIYLHKNKSVYDYYYSVFHEYGHAIHYSSIKCKNFIYKILPDFYNESMAFLFDRFLYLNDTLDFLFESSKVKESMKNLSIPDNELAIANNFNQFLFEKSVYELGNKIDSNKIQKFKKKLSKDNLNYEKKYYSWCNSLMHTSLYPFHNLNYILAKKYVDRVISKVIDKIGKYSTKRSFNYIIKNYLTRSNKNKFKYRFWEI
ncbi:MAG: hypothetical protein FXF47_08455 [Candidatus Mcinerneyibacterium aminivorans]|uniref:Peptidase M3A/M3B catalytic domain-containing protein n=1 Tax=Candidatus Mcinerneyibacterium aminivorans TaxID=2703815 RepID=A0A5D0MGI1_9BACT|nr:MAG: hypothetical protein FXF47_08455 [Candidatus Mcinerneyibacterium aminivorans]